MFYTPTENNQRVLQTQRKTNKVFYETTTEQTTCSTKSQKNKQRALHHRNCGVKCSLTEEPTTCSAPKNKANSRSQKNRQRVLHQRTRSNASVLYSIGNTGSNPRSQKSVLNSIGYTGSNPRSQKSVLYSIGYTGLNARLQKSVFCSIGNTGSNARSQKSRQRVPETNPRMAPEKESNTVNPSLTQPAARDTAQGHTRAQQTARVDELPGMNSRRESNVGQRH